MPDFVPTDVRVPVFVDVAVLVLNDVALVPSVLTTVEVIFDDFVDVFVGIEVDLGGAGKGVGGGRGHGGGEQRW